MANELTLTSSLRGQKNSVAIEPLVKTKNQTMESTLDILHHTVQHVGYASAEDLSSGDADLSKQYFVNLWNRDTTNYVTVSIYSNGTTAVDGGVMLPGEPYGPVRLPAQVGGFPALKMQAHTAACDVEVLVAEAGNPAA